jgi:hypothetical protein
MVKTALSFHEKAALRLVDQQVAEKLFALVRKVLIRVLFAQVFYFYYCFAHLYHLKHIRLK